MPTQPILQIIIGSTRPKRVGGAVADWFIERAQQHGHFDVQVEENRDTQKRLNTLARGRAHLPQSRSALADDDRLL